MSRRRRARHETAVVEYLSVGPDLENDRARARGLVVDTHIGREARTRPLQSVTDERRRVDAEALLVGPPANADRLAVAGHGFSVARVSFDRTETIRNVRPRHVAEISVRLGPRRFDARDPQRDDVVGRDDDAGAVGNRETARVFP